MFPILLALLAAPPDLASIAAATQGRAGAAALLIESGQTLGLAADRRFPMQSVYKFPIAYAVLREVDAGRFRLEQPIRVEPVDLVTPAQHSPLRDRHPKAGVEIPLRELLRLNTSESDGTACDTLLRIIGGPQRVMAHLKQLRISDIVVADTERTIGTDHSAQYRNYATPNGALELLKALHESRGLSPSSRQVLLQHMTETQTGLQRLKGLLPPDTKVAHKTGTSGTRDGITAATNDIGLITLPDGRHLAIAVFLSDSPASQEVREKTIARLALAFYDYFSPR